MRKTKSGFTIVELLIVIVVIAILAAISIVAYNGIQDRARLSKTTNAVAAWAKALRSYKAVNGSYPTNVSCLGSGYGRGASGVESTGGNCRQDSGSGGFVNEQESFNTLMKEYIQPDSATPAFVTAKHPTGFPWYRGAYFYPAYSNSTGSSPARIDFVVDSSVACPTSVSGGDSVSAGAALQGGRVCIVSFLDSLQ